ncbi:MAG: hypothetical protein AAF512_16065, partial [Pseudomonadota bacterium]
AHKQQNKAEQYHVSIDALHQRGICVMAGFISGFDGDSPISIKAMAKRLYEVGVDVPFLSVLTPFRGTVAYEKMVKDKRMLADRGWEYYNGYNVTFQPAQMSPDELLRAHRALWQEAFSFKYSVLRIIRSARYLRWGAFLMCAFMNTFYCLKRLRGNVPISFEGTNLYTDIFQATNQDMHALEQDKAVKNTAGTLPDIPVVMKRMKDRYEKVQL